MMHRGTALYELAISTKARPERKSAKEARQWSSDRNEHTIFF